MSASVAQIVGSQNFLGQTAALSASTIFTPSADGLYRVNIYMTRLSGTGFITATLGWTDNGGSQINNNQIEAPAPASQSLPIWATAGNPITIQASITGSPTYDIRTTVEAL